MPYLTEAADIRAVISKFALNQTLWVDTEVADCRTSQPRLSLIQVLDDLEDLRGNKTHVLDVLDRPELVEIFRNKIMVNPKIEKVFHNANFDLRFLGGSHARNVTCTFNLARTLKKRLSVTNLQLKTLAVELCNFSDVNKEEGKSDWGQRPLTNQQLHYAQMDPVYLAQMHCRLLKLTNQSFRGTAIKNAPAEVYPHQPNSSEDDPDSCLFSPENTEDKQIWSRVLDHIQRRTVQTLLRQHGHLIGFSANVAWIGIRSEPLLKRAQQELLYVEAAFQKACGRQVKVILQVKTPPESTTSPAAQQPTPNPAKNAASFPKAN